MVIYRVLGYNKKAADREFTASDIKEAQIASEAFGIPDGKSRLCPCVASSGCCAMGNIAWLGSQS